MSELFSEATLRNWKKLNVKDLSGKLSSRANKRLSDKQLIPMEYVSDPASLTFLKELLAYTREHIWEMDQVIYSLMVSLLKRQMILDKPHVQNVLREYEMTTICEICAMELPEAEFDLLGLVYQTLRMEGEKNRTGSYYTKKEITSEMIGDLDFSEGQTLLEPCCGSGAFLLSVEHAKPEQLVGMDIDPIAVMIAKCNLLLKYPMQEFEPQIFCGDYISQTPGQLFDYVVTNPPWGAAPEGWDVPEIHSGESFSHFMVRAYYHIREHGILRFLLPKSILNVRAHRDIRHFLLENGSIRTITKYSDSFSGVMTGYIALEVRKELPRGHVQVRGDIREYQINAHHFRDSKNLVFQLLREEDYQLIKKLREKCSYTLKDSLWGVGIVTGNNKKILKKRPFAGCERIYTGKEIGYYVLKPAVNYLKYERESLQQVAIEGRYRAPEKLVYRFISHSLVAAYDNTGSLFLNSANILIPRIPGMSMKTVLAFLNSEIYQYLYTSQFGEVKILKGNLMQLGFPKLTACQDQTLTALVERVLNGDAAADEEIQDVLYYIFGIRDQERERIETYGQKRGIRL